MNLAGHKGKVNAVCVTKNGKQAYTAGDDAAVRIWDLTTGSLVKALTRHTAPVISLATMFNGEFVASADVNKQICLWDANRIVGRIGGEYVSNWDTHAVCFNELSDSLVLATGAEGGGGAVRRLHLNIENEPPVATVDAPAGNGPPLVKRPDPAMADASIATSKELSGRVVDCLYSSDGKRLYAVTQQGDVHVLDPLTLEEIQKQKIVDGAVVHAVVAPQTIPTPAKPAKDWLYVLDENKHLHVFDPDKGQVVKNQSLETQLNDSNKSLTYVMAVAPDSRFLFIWSRAGWHGAMWDVKNNSDALVGPLLRPPFKTGTHAVAFSADARFGAAAAPAKIRGPTNALRGKRGGHDRL